MATVTEQLTEMLEETDQMAALAEAVVAEWLTPQIWSFQKEHTQLL